MLYAPNSSNTSERRNTALKVAIVKAYQQEKSWQRHAPNECENKNTCYFNFVGKNGLRWKEESRKKSQVGASISRFQLNP